MDFLPSKENKCHHFAKCGLVYHKYWKKSALFLYFVKNRLGYSNGYIDEFLWNMIIIWDICFKNWINIKGDHDDAVEIVGNEFLGFFCTWTLRCILLHFFIFAVTFFPCNGGSLIWILPFFWHDFFLQLKFSEINHLIDLICKFITSWPLIHSNLTILRNIDSKFEKNVKGFKDTKLIF